MATTTQRPNLWKRPALDYTSRDFESIRDDMIRTIPFFTPEWTDYNPSDFGIVLIELFAGLGDVLHFYVDRVFGEAFLPTAVTREAVVNLLKLIDYQLRGKVAATADIKFSLAEPLTGDLVIPSGTLLKTLCDRAGSQVDELSNAIYFETVQDLTIPAGALEGTVGAVQGKTSRNVLLGTSDGLPNQKFKITEVPIIEGTPRIFVDEGAGPEEWEILDTLIESLSCDKVCMAKRLADGTINVIFGDNGQGKIPDPGAPITAEYRVGGGQEGNVGADTITIIESPILYAGAPITVKATNPEPASGGEDEQSIESARLEGPRSLRALYRAVTAEDYESLAEAQPGVAKAKAVVGQRAETNHTACCMVSLYVVPVGGGRPSAVLKNDLVEYFDPIKAACTCVEVFDPLYQPIDVKGSVTIYSNFNAADVRDAVLAHIDAYFDEGESPYTGFDKDAYLSDIVSVIDGVDGVDHVDLTDFTRQPAPRFQVWEDDSATFDEDEWEIGPDSVDEEWTVSMTGPNTFSVSGSISGFQGTGTVGTAFASTNGNLKFLMKPGTNPNAAGDFVKFRTSPKLANVSLLAGEFFIKGLVDLIFAVGGVGPRLRCV